MTGRGSHWHGVLPATLCPFKQDLSIDEVELARYTQWLCGHDGIRGLVCNGHTGECGSLLPEERADVTRIMAEAANGAVPAIMAVAPVARRKVRRLVWLIILVPSPK